jgi:hypothetical protein
MDAGRMVVAESDKEFDRRFRETSCVVSFEGEADEAAYVLKDSRLIELIGKECSSFLSRDELKQVHQVEDWWPSQTRYVDCNAEVFSAEFVDRLRGLLQGPYDGWRIQVVVYEDMMKGATMIGSVVIHAEWLLIDRELLPYLR